MFAPAVKPNRSRLRSQPSLTTVRESSSGTVQDIGIARFLFIGIGLELDHSPDHNPRPSPSRTRGPLKNGNGGTDINGWEAPAYARTTRKPGFPGFIAYPPRARFLRRAGERRGFCQAELSPSFRWGDGFMKSRAMSRFSPTAMSLRWDDGGGWKRKEKGCEIRWPSQIRGDGRWMPPCFPVGCFLIRRPGERRGLGSG